MNFGKPALLKRKSCSAIAICQVTLYQKLPFSLLPVVLALVILFGTSEYCVVAGSRHAQFSSEPNFPQMCEASFSRWDSNRDGLLNMDEINALLENPQVRGAEAAALVTLRSHLIHADKEIQNQGMNLTQLLAFASERRAQKDYVDTFEHIKSVNRVLFLPGDPSLLAIHQGALGDCYLLAIIGASVNRDPGAVRHMIRPRPDGGYEVHFPTGKTVLIKPLTDAELVMLPGMESGHGVWVAVLEKAYAEIRQDNQDQRTGETATPADSVPRDWLAGGRAAPTIEQWTGHQAQRMVLQRQFQGDFQKAITDLDPLLTKLTANQRLIAAGKGDHLFAVLGYDSRHQIVRLFNPHGETSTPEGLPGPVNGYVTRDGVFEIPLRDFVQIFHTLSWETGDPWHSP